MNNPMKACYYCKGALRTGRVRSIRERDQQVFVVDDVPAHVCTQCGEEFFEGWVLEEMDRLMSTRSDADAQMTIPVKRFTRNLAALST